MIIKLDLKQLQHGNACSDTGERQRLWKFSIGTTRIQGSEGTTQREMKEKLTGECRGSFKRVAPLSINVSHWNERNQQTNKKTYPLVEQERKEIRCKWMGPPLWNQIKDRFPILRSADKMISKDIIKAYRAPILIISHRRCTFFTKNDICYM